MSALLPCECGGNPEPDSARIGPPTGMTHALRFRLFCAGGRCNASTSWCETMDLAIAAWNRRTPPPLPTREDILNTLLAVPARNYEFDYNEAADAVLRLLDGEG